MDALAGDGRVGVADGFLAAGVVGLLTSFLAGVAGLAGCAAVDRPAEGAVAPGLELGGLAEGAVFAAVDVDVGRVAGAAEAGLVVLETAGLSGLAAAVVAGLGAVEEAGLGPAVLGFVLASPLGPTDGFLFAGETPVAVFAPLVAAGEEAGLAVAAPPAGFLSAILAAAVPTGLLGGAAAVGVVFFFSGAAALVFFATPLVRDLGAPLAARFWAVPGREPGPVVPAAVLVPAPAPGFALAGPFALVFSSPALPPFPALAAGGAVSCGLHCSSSPGCDGGGPCPGSSPVGGPSVTGSAPESMGSNVAVATPSGFISPRS